MKDGHTEDLISERKLLWDDENRLLAINDNGYVSSYLYNANGDRTVKLSGNNEAVYVNTVPSANETQTDRFTIYPSPYMVFTNGGRYTKHIYIGSERIVSKVAIDNGYNPATTQTAAYGNDTYVTRLNYKDSVLNDNIKAIYSKFQLPYNGLNNDEIIQGFQPALMSLASTASNTDNYEEYSYYIHSNHLGSTSYITNSDGEVSQHVEYVPFGEVFIEELSSSAKLNTPYLFNGKELDEETGLYYYGARYYDPRTSLWLSTDPMELKYPNISSYAYCANNPLSFVDRFGLEPDDENRGYYKATVETRTIGFAVRNPIAANRIGAGVTPGTINISTNSTRFATRGEVLFGSKRSQEDRGSENGAFRHALWQATITSEFGYDVALQAGNAHEANPLTDISIRVFTNLNNADETVDLLNNIIGRNIGQKNSNKDMRTLALLILEEFKNNGLYVATQIDNNWVINKAKLSEAKYNALYNIFMNLNENGFTPDEQKQYDLKMEQKLERLQIIWGTMK